MEFSRFTCVPVIDCHVHPWPPWRADNTLDEAALKAKSLELRETITRGRLSQMHVYGNPDHSALYLKAANPGIFYAGGYAPWSFEAKNWKGTDLPRYIESLVGLGYDGIGEMGAKPVTRGKHTPLDSLSLLRGLLGRLRGCGPPRRLPRRRPRGVLERGKDSRIREDAWLGLL